MLWALQSCQSAFGCRIRFQLAVPPREGILALREKLRMIVDASDSGHDVSRDVLRDSPVDAVFGEPRLERVAEAVEQPAVHDPGSLLDRS
jgi:hypothetical protein